MLCGQRRVGLNFKTTVKGKKMNRIVSLSMVLAVLMIAHSAWGKVITVTWDTDSYYRAFDDTELLEQPDGSYTADFIDQFIFNLDTQGSLNFSLSVPDNHGGFWPEWIEIADVSFASGVAPDNVTGWVKKDPYSDTSNLTNTWMWNNLNPGSYTLNVAGTAFIENYPLVSYWMEDLTFSAAPVPEPATLLLFGTGIAGLAAIGRRKD